jgi:hypothetical protein
MQGQRLAIAFCMYVGVWVADRWCSEWTDGRKLSPSYPSPLATVDSEALERAGLISSPSGGDAGRRRRRRGDCVVLSLGVVVSWLSSGLIWSRALVR